MSSMAAVPTTMMGCRPPFTAAQWQELEQQALIFKYLIARVPVPPELLIPIRTSFEASSGRYYPHPSFGYCYYGKKLDPEPGRCRRTDGKKWRCSKEAYPDSKYCERHMHRGRNRSRKPVESQTVSQTQSSPSTVTGLTLTGSNANSSNVGSFQNIPLHSVGGRSNVPSSYIVGGSSSSQMPIDPGSLDHRYLSGRLVVDEHSFFPEASGTSRGLGMETSNSWHVLPPEISSFTMSKPRGPSVTDNAYPQIQSAQGVRQVTFNSLPREEHQYSFFGKEFRLGETLKHENLPHQSFCNEWPKTRDFWSDSEEDKSNRTSYTTTQLSISIPMVSDFSSRSPTDG